MLQWLSFSFFLITLNSNIAKHLVYSNYSDVLTNVNEKVTISQFHAAKYGNVVTIYVEATLSSDVASGTVLWTMKEGFRPEYSYAFWSVMRGSGAYDVMTQGWATNAGTTTVYAALPAGRTYFTISYITPAA